MVPARAGIYERLVDRGLRQKLLDLQERALLGSVDDAEAPDLLARYLAWASARALGSLSGERAGQRQWELVNEVLGLLGRLAPDSGIGDADLLDDAREELLAIAEAPGPLVETPVFPERPGIPLRATELLVNARDEHRVGHELIREFDSADRIDLLCAFLKWSGYRLIRDSLKGFIERRGPDAFRLLTTVYLGATDPRVLDDLRSLQVPVRVSLNRQRTRLHAKAWLFHRDSGFDTAFIGSSNLSRQALLDGLEWNVRVSGISNPEVLRKFEATFNGYWDDGEFLDYALEEVREAFADALRAERSGREEATPLLDIDLRPYPFQEELLESLQAARELHNRHRNLIVAATGTGKTLVAAFDYQRLAGKGALPSLLFVAHRQEILRQSRHQFRQVLRRPEFGELLVAGERPRDGRHVFASVQSLARSAAEIPPGAFDVLIVDEFHHAAAPTYRRLLDRLRPRELLGLTATPERTDGTAVQDIWFEGRVTADLRLWDALERGFLCPFQYFGVDDGTDLSTLRWRRGGYAPEDLERIYTGNDARVVLVLREIRDKVSEPSRMRALGFCVSVEHARFMARKFQDHGLAAEAVTGETPERKRQQALEGLRSGSLQVLFTVDLFNEGVDVPTVDTLLLLRPTDSPVLFQQQLGRGLRHAPDKDCLTVLDFIGQAHRRFSWAARLAAILGGQELEVRRHVEAGFPVLPSGCSMKLDRIAERSVLDNLRRTTAQRRDLLIDVLRTEGSGLRLREFLEQSHATLEHIYARTGDHWTGLRCSAFPDSPKPRPEAEPAWRGVARLRHLDDPELLPYLRSVIDSVGAGTGQVAEEPPARRAEGSLWTARAWDLLACVLIAERGVDAGNRIARRGNRLRDLLAADPGLRTELDELFEAQLETTGHLSHSLEDYPELPLRIHCRYSQHQVLAAFGSPAKSLQGGVWFERGSETDVFFVTLRKSEKEYSPTTMYRDFALSPELFHWESQNVTAADSPTGRRYQRLGRGVRPALLFVRKQKKRGGFTEPFVFLGPASYVSHEGERPMAITLRLSYRMPGWVYREARLVAG